VQQAFVVLGWSANPYSVEHRWREYIRVCNLRISKDEVMACDADQWESQDSNTRIKIRRLPQTKGLYRTGTDHSLAWIGPVKLFNLNIDCSMSN